MPEELLVQKLCATLWRHRRLLQAECVEISKVSEFIEHDTREREIFELEERDRLSFHGMLYHCDNPLAIGRIIELLEELRQNLRENGFEREEDIRILCKIYGVSSKGEMLRGMLAAYTLFEGMARLSSKDESAKQELTPDKSIDHAVKYVDEEIRRLRPIKETLEDARRRRTRNTVEESLVPPPNVLERLLRYEASLDRSFDRTLNQLERLQRIRLGQAVAPPVKVLLSH